MSDQATTQPYMGPTRDDRDAERLGYAIGLLRMLVDPAEGEDTDRRIVVGMARNFLAHQ